MINIQLASNYVTLCNKCAVKFNTIMAFNTERVVNKDKSVSKRTVQTVHGLLPQDKCYFCGAFNYLELECQPPSK